VGIHGWDRPAVDGEDASVIAGGVAKGKAEPQPIARCPTLGRRWPPSSTVGKREGS
jgi:hypothetical protein